MKVLIVDDEKLSARESFLSCSRRFLICRQLQRHPMEKKQ